MLVRTIIHQDAKSVPILGLMGWLSVLDCCRDVSNFVLLIWILCMRVIPNIMLGNPRDLACRGSRSSCRCYCRLCRSRNLFDTVRSFSFALCLFLSCIYCWVVHFHLCLWTSNLWSYVLCSYSWTNNVWSYGQHVHIRSNSLSVSQFCSFLHPCGFCLSLSRHRCSCRLVSSFCWAISSRMLDAARCVAGTEEWLLVQTLHLKRSSHDWRCFVKEDSFLHRLVEEVSRDWFPLVNVLPPFIQGNLISCELRREGLHVEDCAHEAWCSWRCIWRISRGQSTPRQCSIHICDPSDHRQCWSSYVHHQDVEEFLGWCKAVVRKGIFDFRHAHIWARCVLCACQ